MMIGVIFEDIKINENNIIDGHHRYLSSVIAEVNINKVGCPKQSLINCYNWNEVDFVYEEWDTKSKINYMNELDAKYSGIPLIIMTEITK